MNKLLSLMHDTSGKTNRIRENVKCLFEELEKIDKSILSHPLSKNKNLSISGLLHDTKSKADWLDSILDEFYKENKDAELSS